MPRGPQLKPRVEFSQEIFDRICEKIADGASVRAACTGNGMPNRSTFNKWRKLTIELQAQYDEAYREYEENACDDIQYISDTVKDAARAKNMMDSRKWRLKIRNRKIYGDHISAEHSGPDGGPIRVQRVRLNMVPVEELPE